MRKRQYQRGWGSLYESENRNFSTFGAFSAGSNLKSYGSGRKMRGNGLFFIEFVAVFGGIQLPAKQNRQN